MEQIGELNFGKHALFDWEALLSGDNLRMPCSPNKTHASEVRMSNGSVAAGDTTGILSLAAFQQAEFSAFHQLFDLDQYVGLIESRIDYEWFR